MEGATRKPGCAGLAQVLLELADAEVLIIAAVVQGKRSNYDTDLLQAVIATAAKLAGRTYATASAEDQVSLRVIADHAPYWKK